MTNLESLFDRLLKHHSAVGLTRSELADIFQSGHQAALAAGIADDQFAAMLTEWQQHEGVGDDVMVATIVRDDRDAKQAAKRPMTFLDVYEIFWEVENIRWRVQS
jgi:hypothetical protein